MNGVYWERTDTQRNVARVLFGQFVRADLSQHVCSVKNVTPQGAEFTSAVFPAYDERLTASLEHLGRVECIACRATDNGFLVQWNVRPDDRIAFLTKLTWLEDYYEGKTADSRQHNRRPMQNTRSVVTLLDGRRVPCEIIDLSLTGAAIALTMVPDIGSKVYLGKVLCEVMRHTDEGLGVRFLTGFGGDLMMDVLAGEAI